MTADNEVNTPWPYGASGNNSDGIVYTNYATTGITINSTTATNNSTTAINNSTGGGAAHNNMPPYYALALIMKL